MKLTDADIEKMENAANMLKAIAHPMRIAIINLLDEGKRLTVSEIQENLGIEQASTSHHLSILKDKGVLQSRRDGKNTFYFLRDENFTHIVECLGRCHLNH